jgi:hypothetical protein
LSPAGSHTEHCLAASLVTLSELVITELPATRAKRNQLSDSISAPQLARRPGEDNRRATAIARAGCGDQFEFGRRGSAKTIRIRSASSVNSNQPLLCIMANQRGHLQGNVQGQAYDRMNDLNPDEIERSRSSKASGSYAIRR